MTNFLQYSAINSFRSWDFKQVQIGKAEEQKKQLEIYSLSGETQFSSFGDDLIEVTRLVSPFLIAEQK